MAGSPPIRNAGVTNHTGLYEAEVVCFLRVAGFRRSILHVDGISYAFAGFVMAAELPQSGRGNTLDREAEVFHHLITWP